jgi:hypothetical protein
VLARDIINTMSHLNRCAPVISVGPGAFGFIYEYRGSKVLGRLGLDIVMSRKYGVQVRTPAIAS